MKTWGDIFREFLKSTEINEKKIDDYRPHQSIDNCPTIKVWLKDGSILLYLYKGE